MTTTRQDILAATEVAKNKIIASMVTKYDVKVACDSIRDEILESIQAMRLEDQASLRQANAIRDQIWRKLLKIEEDMDSLRKELSAVQHQSINPGN